MDQKKYNSYTLEDYLEDLDFRQWVFQPNPKLDHHWKLFFQQNPKQKLIAEQARIILQEMKAHFQPAQLLHKESDPQFIATLRDEFLKGKQQKRTQRRQQLNIVRLAMAACLLAMVSIGIWFWQADTQPQFQLVQTGYGEWKTFQLPDGSEIKLNANSSIKYPEDWQEGKDRKVWLNGEAFFQVEKDPLKAKFTVITEDLAIEVLGTAFNVHSRNKQTEVFLEEGQIRLEMGSQERLMAPGEFLAYSKEENAITDFRPASKELSSWKDGSLIMRDKTVEEILKKVEEIYGYKVVVNDEALLKTLKTAAIPMDKIEVAIPILERVLGVKMQLKDTELVIE